MRMNMIMSNVYITITCAQCWGAFVGKHACNVKCVVKRAVSCFHSVLILTPSTVQALTADVKFACCRHFGH